jgi:hypothetical protein
MFTWLLEPETCLSSSNGPFSNYSSNPAASGHSIICHSAGSPTFSPKQVLLVIGDVWMFGLKSIPL